MKHLIFFTIWIFTFCLLISAGIREIVFIGINGNGAPSIENSFDKTMRNQLSIQSQLYVADYLSTQNYSRLIRFHDFAIVSRKLVESVERFASDTTLFIWGYISKCDVTPVRKNMIIVSLKGELEINLTIYSLDKKEYAYNGKIHSEALKYKGIFFFEPIEKNIHINAIEKNELVDRCIESAVQKSINVIAAVIRSQSSKDVVIPEENTNVEKYKVPSISDVFSIPSIEAQEIGSESKSKDTNSK